jgi:hypothetical protein
MAYIRRGASGWNERTEKQIVPVHIAAYILNPVNRSLWNDLATHQQQKVIDWLSANSDDIVGQFYDYVDQENNFHPAMAQWKFIDKMKLFWKVAVSTNPINGFNILTNPIDSWSQGTYNRRKTTS